VIVTPDAFCWNAAITAWLNDFWNVDPDPLRLACKLERSPALLVAPGVVVELDPDLLLLPHALAMRANESVKTRSSWVLLKEVKDGPPWDPVMFLRVRGDPMESVGSDVVNQMNGR
jgi:hypothetical protein